VFEGQYVLWGGEHSLFTRKLQAMLNYLGVSYAFKLKSEASQAAVEARLRGAARHPLYTGTGNPRGLVPARYDANWPDAQSEISRSTIAA